MLPSNEGEGGEEDMSKEKDHMEILLEEIRSNVKLALEGHDVLRSEMKQMEHRLSGKIDKVHSSLKNEINVTAMAINDKLDEHIKQPAHT